VLGLVNGARQKEEACGENKAKCNQGKSVDSDNNDVKQSEPARVVNNTKKFLISAKARKK
jgi:hypothetical protein